MALPTPFHNLPGNGNNLIRLNVRCPVCSNPFDFQRMRILGERDQQFLTFIDCAACGTGLMSILAMTPQGMTAQGLITDLTADEIPDAEDAGALTADDVLDLHAMLEQDRDQELLTPINNH